MKIHLISNTYFNAKEAFFEQTVYDRTYDDIIDRIFRKQNPAD